MAAMLVALGGAGYSATGGNFILGATNTASTQTRLDGNLNGRTLALVNPNPGPAATALVMSVAAGHAPFQVNSAVKVANLNADRLDGLDSLHFSRSLTIPFNLAAATIGAPIALPVSRNVFVMTTSNTITQSGRGVAFATVTRLSSGELGWVGLHSPGSAALTAARGVNDAVGTDMLSLDSQGGLVLEVAGPGSIRLANNNVSEARAGTVTLLW